MVWKLSLRAKSFNLLIFRLVLCTRWWYLLVIEEMGQILYLVFSASYLLYGEIGVFYPLYKKETEAQKAERIYVDSTWCVLVSNPHLCRYSTYCIYIYVHLCRYNTYCIYTCISMYFYVDIIPTVSFTVCCPIAFHSTKQIEKKKKPCRI